MKVALIALLVLVAPAAGVRKYFKTNTDFDNVDNWFDGVVPNDSASPSMTTVGTSGQDMVSYVSPAVHNVGKKLVFANNFKLVLGNDKQTSTGAKLKFDESNQGVPAKWEVDLSAERFQYNCHKNWFTDPEFTSPTTLPPCDVDEAIFLGMHSYYTTTSETDNFNTLKFTVRGQEYDECSALPAPEFNLDCDVFGTAVCQELGYVKDDDRCICHTSCPESFEREIAQNAEKEKAQQKQGQDLQDELDEIVTKNFDSKFDLSTLGIDKDVMEDILSDSEDRAQLENHVITTLAETWGVHKDNVTIDSIEITDDGLRVVITGSVTAPKSTFLEPGEDVDDFNPDTIMIDITGEWNENDTNKLADALRKAVVETVNEEIIDDSNKMQDEILNQCSSCPDSTSNFLDDLENSVTNPDDVVSAISACVAEDPVTAQCLKDNFSGEFKKDVDPASQDEFFQHLADLLNEGDKTEITDLITQVGVLIKDRNEQRETARDLPRAVNFVTEPIPFANFKTETQVATMTNTVNRPRLQEAIANGLSNNYGMLDVFSNSAVRPIFPTRRRSDASFIEVELNYTTLCTPAEDGSTDHCAITSDSAQYDDITAALNIIAAAFVVDGHHMCFDPNTGYDEACLQQVSDDAWEEARNRGVPPDEARELARQAYIDAAKCDSRGINPDTGECFGERDLAEIENNADAAVASSEATVVLRSSDSGGLPIIPIAAAVGGLLVIALIVFVVMRSRGSKTHASSSSEDRNVVAFENPMYDDPSGNVAPEQPTYDDAGNTEGLYDEPAFAATTGDKANPLYESTEDLTGFGDDAGYLDVAPEE